MLAPYLALGRFDALLGKTCNLRLEADCAPTDAKHGLRCVRIVDDSRLRNHQGLGGPQIGLSLLKFFWA